ncbi:hypothetical protein CAAN1_06S02234 [[Candida] anglica]|uniref:RING-type domain-containing protein n=1 Tax=[Candida] anglica TaxID=148631 RepID=A0ABP0EN98_9ASCO
MSSDSLNGISEGIGTLDIDYFPDNENDVEIPRYSSSMISSYTTAFNLQHLEDRPNLRNIKYKAPTDHLNCPICQQPFMQPLTTVCGHTFCKECIYECLKMQSMRTSNRNSDIDNPDPENLQGSCPLDRTPLDSSKTNDLFPTPLIVANLVDELEVFCLNNERGCEWTGCRWELERHVMNDCGFTGVSCNGTRINGEKCSLLVERRHLKEDLKQEDESDDLQENKNNSNHECAHKIYNCQFCSVEITKLTEDDHLSTDCNFNYTSCKLCLNDLIPVKNLTQHEENCFKVGHLKCPAHEIGCDWVGNNETALEIHLQKNNCQLSNLLPYMKKLNEKVDKLSTENSFLQRQINKILDSIIQGKITNLGYHEPMEEINKFSSELSNLNSQDKMISLNCELDRLKFELEEKILPYINKESSSSKERDTILSNLVNDSFMMKDDLNLQRLLMNSLRKQLQFMLFTRNPGVPNGGFRPMGNASPYSNASENENQDFFDISSRSNSEEKLNLKL